MDLLSLFRLMARRKVVVIPMTLLVVAGLYYVYSSAPPVYQAGGSVVLAPPKQSPAVDPAEATATVPQAENNPYVRYDSLGVMVDIVVRQMNSSAVGEGLVAKGVAGTYTVGTSMGFGTTGPIIDVTATAPTAEGAQKSAELVIKEIGVQLKVLQDRQNTDPDYQIYTIVVNQPEAATSVFSSTLRRLMMAGVLGVIAIIGSAVLVDAFLARRSGARTEPTARRRFGRSVTPDEPAGAVEPDGVVPPLPEHDPAGPTAAPAHHEPSPAATPASDVDAETLPTSEIGWDDATGAASALPRRPRPRGNRTASVRSRAGRR